MKPFNSGTDGIDNSDAAWSTKKCTTPKFRPAAPSVTIVRIADRRVWIQWSEPNNHGAAISQYVLTMCKGNCDPSSNANFRDARYMCAGGGIDLKCCGRNENNVLSPSSANNRCVNPDDSKLAPVGTPFEVAYDLNGLESDDQYCPCLLYTSPSPRDRG